MLSKTPAVILILTFLTTYSHVDASYSHVDANPTSGFYYLESHRRSSFRLPSGPNPSKDPFRFELRPVTGGFYIVNPQTNATLRESDNTTSDGQKTIAAVEWVADTENATVLKFKKSSYGDNRYRIFSTPKSSTFCYDRKEDSWVFYLEASDLLINRNFGVQDFVLTLNPVSSTLPVSQVRKELISSTEAIRSVIGERPRMVRPPYGSYNEKINQAFGQEGYRLNVMWEIDTLDWKNRNDDMIRIIDQQTTSTSRSIILLHDLWQTTVDRVERIIDLLRGKGLSIVTLEECLEAPAYQSWNDMNSEPATVVRQCKKPGNVALTFDDGPRGPTRMLLDILKRKNAKATFFVIGTYLSNPVDRSTMKRAFDEGHQIAEHTFTHPDLVGLLNAGHN